MTTVNKKRFRISSSGSNSNNVDQGNPKTHENGGKRRNLGDNEEGDTETGLKSNTCVVCNGKDNWVLICHREECPIAIHQSCVSDEPDFDEFGNFYCPYCWYKRVVVKCLKLQKKLMVTDKSSKGREILRGVDLGFLMDQETENIENVTEVNDSGGGIRTSVDTSGHLREGNESNGKCMVMEKNQKMKEVAVEIRSLENAKADDADVDKGENNHETLDQCISNTGEGRKGKARGCVKSYEQVPVSNSDVGEKRKKLRRCGAINHETAQEHSIDVGVKIRKQRRYSVKIQLTKRVGGTHEQDVFINDGETQASDSDLGEGRNGQGCCHETDKREKLSSTERREQEVPRTDKNVLHGSGLEEGRHIEKKHTETVVTETQEKEVSKDSRKRKQEGGVERDRDEFYFSENQDKQCQPDMRIDDVAFSEQVNGFSKDEQVERNSVSSMSSPESADNVNESNAASQQLAMIIHPMAALQAQPIVAQPLCSISSKKPSFQPEKYGHKSNLERNGTASIDPGQRKFVLCSERKRRRLFWTQAEEEMLRAGVQKFPGGRNIPWRKILEFGRDVFHDERVPSDLKDKWKNINKVPFDAVKLVRVSTERQPNYHVSEVSSE